MNYTAYILHCLTRMHPGSGDTSFGVIDNQVQRDPVTGLPAINASSLKGALREHFNAIKPEWVEDIFGAESRSDTPMPGNFKFFGAHLLSIPVRSDLRPFYSATSPELLKNMIDLLRTVKITFDRTQLEKIMALECRKKVALVRDNGQADIEEFKSSPADIPQEFTLPGKDPALLLYADFKEICETLPVMARNYLENGESKNLWYEEIIPAQSRFVFIIGKEGPYAEAFDEILTQEPVQIGANASIGYGFTQIIPLTEKVT